MKETILARMGEIIHALGNIDVKGKQNLLNLGGSIAMLEEVYHQISKELMDIPTKPAAEKVETQAIE